MAQQPNVPRGIDAIRPPPGSIPADSAPTTRRTWPNTTTWSYDIGGSAWAYRQGMAQLRQDSLRQDIGERKRYANKIYYLWSPSGSGLVFVLIAAVGLTGIDVTVGDGAASHSVFGGTSRCPDKVLIAIIAGDDGGRDWGCSSSSPTTCSTSRAAGRSRAGGKRPPAGRRRAARGRSRDD